MKTAHRTPNESRRGRRTVLLLLGILGVAAGVGSWLRPAPSGANRSLVGADNPDALRMAGELGALQEREDQLGTTLYKSERLAQAFGRAVENLWDRVNRSTNRLATLGQHPLGRVRLLQPAFPAADPDGIRISRGGGPGIEWNEAAWQRFVEGQRAAGWVLDRMELRQVRFDPATGGGPPRSRFYGSAHLTRGEERAILEGHLGVEWGGTPENPTVAGVDAQELEIRIGRPQGGFELALEAEIAPVQGSYFIDPLLIRDLDGDGHAEVILAAANTVFRWNGGRFAPEPSPLCEHPPGWIFTAILGDFTGDGVVDYLCAQFDGLLLYRGSASGGFPEPGVPCWRAEPRLRYGQVLTAGDIDQDGDLDVWLGQYKVPYDRGQMPHPIHDANDGHPSFLLLNRGDGTFEDRTVASGLGLKRMRRAYSGSFVDLDGDGHLDLVTVSDFAGLDLFRNQGNGRFGDMTSAWASDRLGFGMAHSLADFDADGVTDLLMIGMNSPTADRLDHAGVVRAGFESADRLRRRMVEGNRLLTGVKGGGFRSGPLGGTIARSGWSWGCAAFDLQNDSFLDLYVANGHETRESVREYEPEFWCHDIYVGNSRDSVVHHAYFAAKAERTRGRGMSYGGYEKNRLFLNRGGTSFTEAAHLFGLGFEQDSRNVGSEDFDGDGLQDLVFTTFEIWPRQRQTVQVFLNRSRSSANWIGIRLPESPGEPSPLGATVRVSAGTRTWIRTVVAGDSYRTQSSPAAHVGLGNLQAVDSVEVHWIGGKKATLKNPAVNRWHSAPKAGP